MIRDKVYGQVAPREDVILSQVEDDLSRGQPWHDQGFVVRPFLTAALWKELESGFFKLFKETLTTVGLEIPNDFRPERYHTLVPNGDQRHLDIISKTKLFDASQFPVDFSIVEKRVSEILGIEVKSTKPFNLERVFHLRVIRPGAPDYNPLHRDVWQAENRNAINLYVPLAGSTESSSLKLVPGSHKWSESITTRSLDGARMNELKFNVPGLMSSQTELELIRPNPKENEVLIFSPYLLHGLSENGNPNASRISLEMRFWRNAV